MKKLKVPENPYQSGRNIPHSYDLMGNMIGFDEGVQAYKKAFDEWLPYHDFELVSPYLIRETELRNKVKQLLSLMLSGTRRLASRRNNNETTSYPERREG